MNENEKKFLAQFKPGEYVVCTILVQLTELDALITVLRSSGLTLAVLPSVQQELDFQSSEGTEQ